MWAQPKILKTAIIPIKAVCWRKKTDGKTTLSSYFWKKVEEGSAPTVSWKILEANLPTYNPVSRVCRLCLREMFNITLNPHLATLNSRREIFAHCRHMRWKLIVDPPD